MTEKTYHDRVFELANGYANEVHERVKRMIGKRPFQSVTMKPEIMVQVAESLQPQEIDALVQEFGEHNVGYFLYSAHKARRRQVNG